MSKTFKHQAVYDVLNGKDVPCQEKIRVLRWFNRVNFWDTDSKITYRIRKDWRRGIVSRIKKRKYK